MHAIMFDLFSPAAKPLILRQREMFSLRAPGFVSPLASSYALRYAHQRRQRVYAPVLVFYDSLHPFCACVFVCVCAHSLLPPHIFFSSSDPCCCHAFACPASALMLLTTTTATRAAVAAVDYINGLAFLNNAYADARKYSRVRRRCSRVISY